MNDVESNERKFTRNDFSGTYLKVGKLKVFSYSSQKFEHNSVLNYIFGCIGNNMDPVFIHHCQLLHILTVVDVVQAKLVNASAGDELETLGV